MTDSIRPRDPNHTYEHHPLCDDNGWDHRGPCVIETEERVGTTRQYLVTIHDTGNITDDPRNIHTILTSRDHISPRERVEVEPYVAADGLPAL